MKHNEATMALKTPKSWIKAGATVTMDGKKYVVSEILPTGRILLKDRSGPIEVSSADLRPVGMKHLDESEQSLSLYQIISEVFTRSLREGTNEAKNSSGIGDFFHGSIPSQQEQDDVQKTIDKLIEFNAQETEDFFEKLGAFYLRLYKRSIDNKSDDKTVDPNVFRKLSELCEKASRVITDRLGNH